MWRTHLSYQKCMKFSLLARLESYFRSFQVSWLRNMWKFVWGSWCNADFLHENFLGVDVDHWLLDVSALFQFSCDKAELRFRIRSCNTFEDSAELKEAGVNKDIELCTHITTIALRVSWRLFFNVLSWISRDWKSHINKIDTIIGSPF